ncbi:MAG: class I SAM-dependent methyltransferase [Saccharofermentanales bacterium]|jgi:ubiquinone/menaquinone biosynthesis C-methylase UbiE
MTDWSKYVQNPAFLEATRMMMFDPDTRDVLIKWAGIKNGMRVLDVGCGTGALTFFLAEGLSDCEFVGLDIDEHFIACANEKKEQYATGGNSFSFVIGDALKLPFDNASFDAVVSHTFLTNVPDPHLALREMMRVGRVLSPVTSITAQSFKDIPAHPGFYEKNHLEYYEEWVDLFIKLYSTYEEVLPKKDYLLGCDPLLVPRLFSEVGMWDIRMHSLGKSCSVSNAAMKDEDKRRYIELLHEAELEKLDSFYELETFREKVSKKEAERFRELMKIRRDLLLAECGENATWEWYGGASLVMTGIVPPTLRTLLRMTGKDALITKIEDCGQGGQIATQNMNE